MHFDDFHENEHSDPFGKFNDYFFLLNTIKPYYRPKPWFLARVECFGVLILSKTLGFYERGIIKRTFFE